MRMTRSSFASVATVWTNRCAFCSPVSPGGCVPNSLERTRSIIDGRGLIGRFGNINFGVASMVFLPFELLVMEIWVTGESARPILAEVAEPGAPAMWKVGCGVAVAETLQELVVARVHPLVFTQHSPPAPVTPRRSEIPRQGLRLNLALPAVATPAMHYRRARYAKASCRWSQPASERMPWSSRGPRRSWSTPRSGSPA